MLEWAKEFGEIPSLRPGSSLGQAIRQPPGWVTLDLGKTETERNRSWAGRVYDLVKPSPGEREVSPEGEGETDVTHPSLT